MKLNLIGSLLPCLSAFLLTPQPSDQATSALYVFDSPARLGYREVYL